MLCMCESAFVCLCVCVCVCVGMCDACSWGGGVGATLVNLAYYIMRAAEAEKAALLLSI